MAVLNDEQLVDLWYDQRPAESVAEMLEISARELQGHWARLKHTGFLPQQQRHRHTMTPLVSSDYNDEKFDGRPSTGRYDADPLLTKLFAVHKEPRYDLFPGTKTR